VAVSFIVGGKRRTQRNLSSWLWTYYGSYNLRKSSVPTTT